MNSGKPSGPRRSQQRCAPEGADVVELVDDLLHRALACDASDVHFEPTDCSPAGLLVRIRRDGLLGEFERIPGRPTAEAIISRLKVLAGLLTYRVDIPQEGSLRFDATPDRSGEPTELRVATFPTVRGERAVVRVFTPGRSAQRLDELGFLPVQIEHLRTAIASPNGLVLITGPAGAGKTTTLYALLRHLREHSPGRSLVTVEDPVEQRLPDVTQIQINPHGELDYERCMRSLLRQDPEVLLLGEIRDARTANVAVEAALTGHLILTTVHSGDPAAAVLRLLEMGVPPYQVVSTLTLVCTQRLLRRRCRCTNDGAASAPECPKCLGTGYAGRVACAHVVPMNDILHELILSRPGAAALRRAMADQPPDLYEAARGLVAEGITDEDEVHRLLGGAPDGRQPGANS